ncbi:PIG-L deacetylase family protein [Armatimonas rosea]|uniref:LmbE family N-acetylglucosaminyl deacetylase n=1 Tax=Armatimonas rosea TaxID=685828 RepID=A0A7W9W8R1_ARMRO|nr:PIG-L family deacetylase [Armatimonas rosea]MBB6052425.1 LmbE family N-acetylglucosaminyl deacetylase [Armatimonas rosea]
MRKISGNEFLETIKRWPRWKRYTLVAFVSPPLLGALFALLFYANLHRSASAMTSEPLPAFPPLVPAQRLLVIAPHCDDETLGVGGVIAQARHDGIPVHVVFLTNGDAFPAACALVTRNLQPAAKDYVKLGNLRQKEALAALKHLGVGPEDVTFLGYPDRGIRALWEANWSPEKPYKSPFTQKDSVRGEAYCGQSLVSDLTQLIQKTRPTDIFVTHPADDHQDHSLAATFTEAALQKSKVERVLMHYYIVHRGDWPLPQGYSPSLPLVPPAGFTSADTHWRTVTLSHDALKAKERALKEYDSQLKLCDRFLNSFLRTSEIFGQLTQAGIDPMHTASVRDGQGDDVVRFANPSTDLTRLDAQLVGKNLKVTLNLRGASAPGVRYALHLRSEKGTFLARTLRSPYLSQPGSSQLVCSIPLAELETGTQPLEEALWISAETGMTARNIVDQTGYRYFALHRP